MSNHGSERVYHGFIGSYLGLLFGWIGLLAIVGGVVLGLREIKVFAASWATLIYWGKVVLGGTAVVYALAMFMMTFVFARRIQIHVLPSMAFAIWGAIPVGNLVPVIILLIIAGIRSDSIPVKTESPSTPPPVPASDPQNTAAM